MRNRQSRLSILLGLFSAAAAAQIPQVTLQTQAPTPGDGHDYIKSLNETVNPSNGQLTVSINIPIAAGRQLSIPFNIIYNSGQVVGGMGSGFEENVVGPVSRSGWAYTVPMLTIGGGEIIDENYGACYFNSDYVFYDASGNATTLSLGATDESVACGVAGMRDVAYAQNGSLFSTSNWDVTDADGTTYFLPWSGGDYLISQIEDRNGNLINISGSSNGVFSYTDTMGRTVLSSSGFGLGSTTLTTSKFTDPYEVTWGTSNYDYSVAEVADIYTLNCSVPSTFPAQGTIRTIQSIALPNSIGSYVFSYDSTYGRINKVTYPTGAYVRYVWGMRPAISKFYFQYETPNGNYYEYIGLGMYANVPGNFTQVTCSGYYAEPVITDRYVSPDGLNETEHQHFQYSTYYPTNVATTTVTDTDLLAVQDISTTTYNYGLAATDPVPNDSNMYGSPILVESSTTTVAGSSTVHTVNKTWNNSDPRELASAKTTLQNGTESSEVDYCYNSFYQVIEKDEFNYSGTGNPGTTCNNTTTLGPLLRKTVTTYSSYGSISGGDGTTNLQYNGQWINDRPSSVIIYGGSNSRAAETDYYYDQNPVTGVTVIAGTHDDANYGPSSALSRANLTSFTKQCFPNCVSATVSFVYDDTGQATSMTSPCGSVACTDISNSATFTAHYSYTDNFATGTPPGATNGYLTKITDPLGHSENFSYNYGSGTLANLTDRNSVQSQYTYNDPLSRLTRAQYAVRTSAENWISYTYPSLTESTSAKDLAAKGDGSIQASAYSDGLGRPTETDQTSDPEGTDVTKTGYDGLGRVQTVTSPYRSQSDATYNITTYTYDALGRQSIISDLLGTKTQSCYEGLAAATQAATSPACNQLLAQSQCPGDWVDITDANGNDQQKTFDALGRLTCVIETNGTSQSPSTSMITTYIYDALNNLVSVNQSGQSRTFTYDSLSRLTTSTNPETGTICYGTWSGGAVGSGLCQNGYDPNGNLVYKTDARGLTTSYSYDSLNRLIRKTIPQSDAPTMFVSTCYQYDSLSGTLGSANLIGHLTAEWTQSGSSCASAYTPSAVLTAKVILSYDAMGRPLQSQQCIGGKCQTSPFAQYQLYDLAGNMTSWTDGRGLMTFNEQFNAAGHPASVTNAFFGNGWPAILFSAQGYTAGGLATNWNVGNFLSFNRSYDKRSRAKSEIVSH